MATVCHAHALLALLNNTPPLQLPLEFIAVLAPARHGAFAQSRVVSQSI